MQIDPVRLHRQSGHDRVAVVSLEPASTPGTVLVRVARGPSAAQLGGGTSYGPYPADQAQEPFALAVQQLKDEGFAELVPGWDLITALKGGDPAARCRAALRCAWRGKTDAADALHAAAEAAVAGKRGEACPLVESLARLGDPRALPLAIALAEKKNLSRRRSGVEALRLLHGSKALPDDARDTLRAALAAARQRGLQRLPPAVAEVLGAMDEESRKKEDVKALVKAALAGDPRRLGLVADVLYEAGTPVTVGAARRILARAQIERPHVWRYAKSVLKRAMLRRDAKTFGFLAHAVEHAALTSPGATANLKSGWDGKKKPLSVFSPKTQQYVRRACWRHLRDLARHQPAAYARTAAEVLVHYSPKDLRPPKGLVGAYGRCYLLGRVLFGGGERLVLDRKLRWRYRSPAVVGRPKQGREESFPALWDAGREAYLRVLTGAKLPDVFHFGLEGLERHPELLRHASLAQLLGLLGAPEELTAGTPLVEKVCAELDRRFDPARPDLGLLARLLMHPQSGHPAVRAIAERWLDQSAPTWTREERSIFQLPLAVDPVLRDHVARTLVEAFRADPALRAAHAEGFLAILKQPDEENRHGGFARVAREALVAELGARLELDAILAWLDEGSAAGRSVAGALLAAHPEGLKALGLPRLVTMAGDELAAVRAAAHALLRANVEALRADPAPLFALAESEWDDTRDVAFALLRDEVGLEHLGMDGLIGLCDSNDEEVEALGRELVVRHFDELDAEQVLYRLSEHPSRAMRAFALGLMQTHLRDGFVPLARLEGYFRAVLFDTWPSRALKWGVLELLLRRGLRDERQAQFAAGLMAELLRTHTRGDFERVAHALAVLQTKHPAIETDLRVRSDAAPPAPEAAE